VCVLLPLSGYAGGECSLKIIGHIKCDQVSCVCVCVLLPLSGYAGGECSWKIVGHIKCDQVACVCVCATTIVRVCRRGVQLENNWSH